VAFTPESILAIYLTEIKAGPTRSGHRLNFQGKAWGKTARKFWSKIGREEVGLKFRIAGRRARGGRRAFCLSWMVSEGNQRGGMARFCLGGAPILCGFSLKTGAKSAGLGKGIKGGKIPDALRYSSVAKTRVVRTSGGLHQVVKKSIGGGVAGQRGSGNRKVAPPTEGCMGCA